MTTFLKENPGSQTINFLYTLDENKKVVKETDLDKWIQWTNTHSRIISKTYIGDQSEIEVSTIFLGVSLQNPPMLFETMIFGSRHEQDLDFRRNYSTYEEAVAGHIEVVETINLRRNV